MAELNETDHRAIHNLYAQGKSVRGIAKLYQCHRRTILKVKRKADADKLAKYTEGVDDPSLQTRWALVFEPGKRPKFGSLAYDYRLEPSPNAGNVSAPPLS